MRRDRTNGTYTEQAAYGMRDADGRVTAVVTIEDHEGSGRCELLRLAAGLGERLQPPFAAALVAAARRAGISPASAEAMMPPDTADVAHVVAAYVEGRQLALGRYNEIVQLGLAPKAAEVHVARHIAAIGNIPLYLMVVDDGRCLGILGIEMR